MSSSRDWLRAATEHGAQQVVCSPLFHLGRYGEALPHVRAVLRHVGPNSYWSPWAVVMVGLTLGGLGDHRSAVMLVAAGSRGNEDQGLADFAGVDRRDISRLEAGAREALGKEAYEAAVRAGEALGVEEAADLALELASSAESSAAIDSTQAAAP